jgi:RimJ/RimL family protein N-acetyltransferase
MKAFESQRLQLRPINENDLQFLMDLRNDKQVMEWLVEANLTMHQQLHWFNSLKKNDYVFVIYKKDGMVPIGTIALFDVHERHRRGRWSLRITPDEWSKGYAKEAIEIFLDYVFNTLNINKLMGDCFAENTREVENLKKRGFKSEGIWREHYYHKGKYRDSIQFTMLKSDYESR